MGSFSVMFVWAQRYARRYQGVAVDAGSACAPARATAPVPVIPSAVARPPRRKQRRVSSPFRVLTPDPSLPERRLDRIQLM